MKTIKVINTLTSVKKLSLCLHILLVTVCLQVKTIKVINILTSVKKLSLCLDILLVTVCLKLHCSVKR